MNQMIVHSYLPICTTTTTRSHCIPVGRYNTSNCFDSTTRPRQCRPTYDDENVSDKQKLFLFLAASSGPPCRGGPLCIDVGLNILQQMKGIPGRPGWLYVSHYPSLNKISIFIDDFSYKCDSQCALEMRCPPGLIFDDIYQRCEWPGASGPQVAGQRLGRLRDKKSDDNKNSTKVKKLRLMTTAKPSNTTLTKLPSSTATSSSSSTVSSTNQTKSVKN